jgi:asparagine synthase (glutamine-hydrolysing)
MCGIAGFVSPPGARADRDVIARMVAALRHRGPDAVGYHVHGRVALGVARLRVIDLETGDQPIACEDGSVSVVLNGEIYGFAALRAELESRGHRFRSRSDTEIIAHAWEDEGERCVDRLNGMFALALWDARRERLFLARDRMGEKPLHYAVAGRTLVFASELRALLAHPAVSARLDPEGLARYLAFDYVPDPHSILHGVRKLPPGHVLTAHDGRLVARRYWDIPFQPEPEVREREWLEEIVRRVDQAVALRLVSDVPVGCFVSGGIDSSVVAGTAALQREGIRTFSVGYEDSHHDERPWARIAARHFGTAHEELVVTPSDAGDVVARLGALLDEPLADMSFVPLYLLSRAARGTVTVALTGDGGDELFAGYPTMAAEWWQSAFERLPSGVLGLMRRGAVALPHAAEPLREFVAATAYHPDARNQALIGGIPPGPAAVLLGADTRARLGAFDPYGDVTATVASCLAQDATARLIYRYCKLYLAGQNLVNSDRASMASGLELRAPFLDHTFVEFMGRIPSSLKLAGFRTLKGLLKRAFAGRLPPEIFRRGKQGFGVPFGDWFRGPLAGIVREVLSPERLRRAGLFDPAAVTRVVDGHLRGGRDHQKPLWSLLAFELWRSEYLGDGAVAW